jgi:O-Antigen ligase
MNRLSSSLRLLLVAVLVLVPLHTLVVVHLLPVHLDVHSSVPAMWKEGLLLAVCCGALLTLARERDWSLTGVEVSVALFLGYAVLSLPFSPSPLAGLYGIRNYGEGFVALLLAARFMPLGERDIVRLMRLLLGIAVLISAWGIFQSAYLGKEFLLANGYGLNGRLEVALTADFPFQRAVGTFGSPNVFGLYLTTILLVVTTVFKACNIRGIAWDTALVVVGAALLAAASRSAGLAFASGIAARWVIAPRPRPSVEPLRILRLVGGSVLLLVIAASPKYVTVVPQHVVRTVTLDDPSAAAHVTSLHDSLDVLRTHPFGVGIGVAGPRAVNYTGRLLNAESSYLIVGMDLGIFGLAAYLGVWSTTVLALRRAYYRCLRGGARTVAEFCRGSFAAMCGAATAGLFLPLNVELEVMLVIFLIAGAALASAMAAPMAAGLEE